MFFETLKEFTTSKKFLFVLVGTLFVLVGAHYGWMTKEEAESFLKVLWPTYLAAQGIADIGAKIAAANLSNAKTYSEADAKLVDQKQAAIGNVVETFTKAFIEATKKSAATEPAPPADLPSQPREE